MISRRADEIKRYLNQSQSDMVDLLRRFAEAESPTLEPESQKPMLSMLSDSLRELGFTVDLVQGRTTGGHLVARFDSEAGHPSRQLLLGHCDTVWPSGTLSQMPFKVEGNVISGPGVYDMKGGLVQMIFALKALQSLDLQASMTPMIFVNSDEEIGSPESSTHIRRLAQEVERVFVLEPSLGSSGRLKTARKGVGQFEIRVHGRSAHAGLEPEKGVSAILELSYVIQKLFAMNDAASGISVNVGLVEGGTRSNVIAARSSAVVDVRVPRLADASDIEEAISALAPEMPGATLEITGKINRRPLERTAANGRLWDLAVRLGREMDLDLEEGMAGGASDGNITSQYTATLDGLGAVGGGAHATHEFLYLDKMVERCALLSLLLLSPETA
jgi:glutamate carboxypeptidase